MILLLTDGKPEAPVTCQSGTCCPSLNEAANAAEACRRKPDSKGIHVRIDVAGDVAAIEVKDDGVGMTAEVAAAVFEPFFTTKPEGEGMGLRDAY